MKGTWVIEGRVNAPALIYFMASGQTYPQGYRISSYGRIARY